MGYVPPQGVGVAWNRVQASLDAHEAATLSGIHQVLFDVIANRPAAGVANRLFFSVDELKLYRDNGTEWEEITAVERLSTHAATNVPTAHDVDAPSPVVVHDDPTVHTTTTTKYKLLHGFTRPYFALFTEAAYWEFRITGPATAYVRELAHIKAGEYNAYAARTTSTTSTTTVSATTFIEYVFMRRDVEYNTNLDFRTSDAAVAAEVSRERLSLIEGRLVVV